MAEAPDIAATLELVRSHSLASVVGRAVERMILDGELDPGQRINEKALAGRLQISRGPVREALRALEQAGFVKLVARRGMFVKEVSLKQALDAYDVRASLFGAAGLTLAKRITREHIDSLTELVTQMDELSQAADTAQYYALNLRFHSLIVTYSDNEELGRIYEALVKKLHLYRHKALVTRGGLAASAREHRAILKALVRRDPEGARAAMEGHVLAGKQRFLRANEGRGLTPGKANIDADQSHPRQRTQRSGHDSAARAADRESKGSVLRGGDG